MDMLVMCQMRSILVDTTGLPEVGKPFIGATREGAFREVGQGLLVESNGGVWVFVSGSGLDCLWWQIGVRVCLKGLVVDIVIMNTA